jgi:hypothetical protein
MVLNSPTSSYCLVAPLSLSACRVLALKGESLRQRACSCHSPQTTSPSSLTALRCPSSLPILASSLHVCPNSGRARTAAHLYSLLYCVPRLASAVRAAAGPCLKPPLLAPAATRPRRTAVRQHGLHAGGWPAQMSEEGGTGCPPSAACPSQLVQCPVCCSCSCVRGRPKRTHCFLQGTHD